jgi:hypothetical protein
MTNTYINNSSARPRITLREQAREVRRSYDARVKERDRIPPWQARQFARRNECMLAAAETLEWFDRHPSVIRGYLQYVWPFRDMEGWEDVRSWNNAALREIAGRQ